MSLLIKNHPQQLKLPLAEKEEDEQLINLTKEEHCELIQALAALIRSALKEDLNQVTESD
jgi:hypothetical protein